MDEKEMTKEVLIERVGLELTRARRALQDASALFIQRLPYTALMEARRQLRATLLIVWRINRLEGLLAEVKDLTFEFAPVQAAVMIGLLDDNIESSPAFREWTARGFRRHDTQMGEAALSAFVARSPGVEVAPQMVADWLAKRDQESSEG